MSVNREELKRLIDFIHEEDTAEVYDFIGYLNMKREREAIDQMDLDLFQRIKNSSVKYRKVGKIVQMDVFMIRSRD